ncbi:putative PEP-CTERM system TPR-repeat lipoprotein [Colwellia chukchiensis]|uniref:Putative PEP-CTERM system TPR-repeat lipoprotein n=1 Tax=Colwellia chukchiensis TaxID=641665 RepID=A0A1H7KK09_9GAMM|nr:XrtA/PEP-CTERM system TPR-repeat protein PrsT [Colwellia chukchiensis]SEK87102.1 putative PEP-CTERM system TPR-repeat lipoprotein [Colwellia chukchiensis]
MTKLTRRFIFLVSICLAIGSNAAELYELANKKFNEHQYAEAKIHIKNLLKQDPSNIAARFLLVELLLADEQAALAETELNIIAGLGGDHKQITLHRSKTLLMQNKYNEVLSLFDDNYIDQIFAAKMYVLKGLAHIGLRQLILAEEAFNQALRINASNFDAQLGLAQIKVNRFQYDEAKAIVEQVLATPFPPEKAWFLKATIDQHLGNVDKALTSINSILINNPENVEALILRATLLYELKDYPAALKDAELVLANVANEPRAKFIQAAIAVQNDDIASSNALVEEIAQTLAKISPSDLQANPSYLYLAGVIFYQQGQYTVAQDYFNQYLAIDNFNVNAKLLLARILMEQGDFESAKSLLVKAAVQHGDNSNILTLLGVCYLELQQFESAIVYFQQVKRLNPSGSVDLQLAKSYLSLNENRKAIKLLNAGDFTNSQQVIASFLLVEAYLKEQNADSAIKIAKKLTQLEPKNPEYQHHLGFVYQRVGDFTNAKLHFQKALELNDLHVKSIISLAQVTSAMGAPEQGFSQLQKALSKQPNEVELLKAIANHYERMGQDLDAANIYQKALLQQPNSEALLLSYAASLGRQDKFKEAIETINSFLLSQQKTGKIYVLLGHLYLKNKQVALAIDSYRDALKFGATKSRVYFYIAKAFQSDRKFSEAVAAYQKSIAWAPTALEPVLAFANYLNQQSRYNDAITALLAFEGAAKTSHNYIATLAHAYYLNKQYQQAEQHYLKIIQSGAISTISGLAMVYHAQQQTEKALALINAGLKSHPNNLVLLSTQAEIHIKNQQWAQAENIYSQLISLNDNQPMLLNNAAYVAMVQAKYELAKAYATRSVEILDNVPDSLDTLGWIYYLTQDYAKALPILRKALAIDYSNVEIKYHLAMTLKALGQEREAFNLLREVVNSQFEFTDKAKAKQVLDDWLKS